MSHPSLPGVLASIAPVLNQYGYLAVGGFITLEDFGVPLPGETILVFGTGLGRTEPRQMAGYVPRSPAQIVLLDRLSVLLDGQALPSESVLYAGITPGYPGLYQIKLRLPDQIENPRPELRITLDDQMSQSGVVLQVAPGDP